MSEEKKGGCSKTTVWLLIAIVVVFAGLYFWGASQPSQPSQPREPAQPATYGVTYEVECDHDFSVTYENDQGGTEQGDYSSFKKYYEMERGDFAYISAQCMEENCDITCKIRVDGELWRESSSSGDYVIATCDGLVGGD